MCGACLSMCTLFAIKHINWQDKFFFSDERCVSGFLEISFSHKIDTIHAVQKKKTPNFMQGPISPLPHFCQPENPCSFQQLLYPILIFKSLIYWGWRLQLLHFIWFIQKYQNYTKTTSLNIYLLIRSNLFWGDVVRIHFFPLFEWLFFFTSVHPQLCLKVGNRQYTDKITHISKLDDL